MCSAYVVIKSLRLGIKACRAQMPFPEMGSHVACFMQHFRNRDLIKRKTVQCSGSHQLALGYRPAGSLTPYRHVKPRRVLAGHD